MDRVNRLKERIKLAKYDIRKAMWEVINMDPEDRSKFMPKLESAEQILMSLEQRIRIDVEPKDNHWNATTTFEEINENTDENGKEKENE